MQLKRKIHRKIAEHLQFLLLKMIIKVIKCILEPHLVMGFNDSYQLVNPRIYRFPNQANIDPMSHYLRIDA